MLHVAQTLYTWSGGGGGGGGLAVCAGGMGQEKQRGGSVLTLAEGEGGGW